jgi:hypothetical protein
VIAVTDLMQLAYLKESVWGTVAAGTPKLLRITGQSLNKRINTIQSEEIRADRMVGDLIKVDQDMLGGVNFEMSYGNVDPFLESMMFSAWVLTPEKINVTADTSIADLVAGTGVITVDAGGTNFKVGHLLMTTGFTNAGNNFVKKVTASAATTVTVNTTGLVNETAPPAGAKMKVVGLEGGSAELNAVTVGGNGIERASGTIDLAAMGLAPGMWVKVGGSAAGEKFTTTANNGWCRVSAVATAKISFDIVPTGWAAEVGTGKTIRLWFGDYIKNGITRTSLSVERQHVDVAQYFMNTGLVVNTAQFNLRTGQIFTGAFDFLGKNVTRAAATGFGGAASAATVSDVMNAASDVVSILDNGAAFGTLQSLTLNYNNNLRAIKGIGVVGSADVTPGQIAAGGQFEVFFENGAIWDKADQQTVSSMAFQVYQDSEAIVMDMPKIKYGDAEVVAGQRNQDCVLRVPFTSLAHTGTAACMLINRLPYFV